MRIKDKKKNNSTLSPHWKDFKSSDEAVNLRMKMDFFASGCQTVRGADVEMHR